MFACIYVPNFPVAAVLRAEPELQTHAIAIFEGKPPLEKIIAVNERARSLGIAPGMYITFASKRKILFSFTIQAFKRNVEIAYCFLRYEFYYSARSILYLLHHLKMSETVSRNTLRYGLRRFLKGFRSTMQYGYFFLNTIFDRLNLYAGSRKAT